MSLRDDDVILRAMLDHVDEAIQIVAEVERTDLDSQRLLYLALLQLSQIIGEAATRVSESVRLDNPEVPWREVIAFRNRLIHGYDSVDRDILWAILKQDFPELRDQLTIILQELTDES